MRNRSLLLSLTAPFVFVLVAGCGAGKDVGDGEGAGGANKGNIVGGVRASDHPEAVLVDMDGAACSGSVIAPKVVMTAGHCVDGSHTWDITAPYAGGQTSHSTTAITLDWKDVAGDAVDPTLHDVGLVILTTPITLTTYPQLAKNAEPDGAKILNLGRIGDGTFSTTDLFVSKPLTSKGASGDGFPYDYITDEIIEPGDSGGPVEDATSHVIVAVNSGAGGGTEVLARVDLVIDWIEKTIADNGGGGGGTVDPGGGGGTPDAGPPPPPPPSTGDEDGDGVPDSQDLCSHTPAGSPVWTSGEWIGCAGGQHRDGGGGADGDGDGIPDNKDRCTHTPAGSRVWQWGDWLGCAAGEHRDA
jgi:hypothetical protein